MGGKGGGGRKVLVSSWIKPGNPRGEEGLSKISVEY